MGPQVQPGKLALAALALGCCVDATLKDASPRLLAKSFRAKAGANTTSNSVCQPLVLPGFVLEGCDSLTPGTSCKVSCKPGFLGKPVRYFCFSALADNGLPPAALQVPVCHNSSHNDFVQDAEIRLAWKDEGCLLCQERKKACSFVADAVPGDDRCTVFKYDPANNGKLLWQEQQTQCLQIGKEGDPRLWSCQSASLHQHFAVVPSEEWPGGYELCTVQSGRGMMCLSAVGLPMHFYSTPPDASLFTPALTALGEGDSATFLEQLYAMQVCRARLDTALPDSFWDWLNEDFHLLQALFATFPVNPGQLNMFYEVREAVGHEKFDSLDMASFAVAVSYINRKQGSIDGMVKFPSNKLVVPDNYLEGDEERIRQEMKEGKHCSLQSNECNNLVKCCGPWESWKFEWPRPPVPTIREWVEFWLKSAEEHGDKLWMNPLNEVPWIFGVYIAPIPLEECEWVHSKLIEGAPMEGKWYLYDASFHERVCAGGDYHPDGIPGIATYGGVCGRMAKLEWWKTNCMGQPATQKGESGHSAGFKFKSVTASFTPLNMKVDTKSLFTLELVHKDAVTLEMVKGSDSFPSETATCVACPKANKVCKTEAAGSSACTHFEFDPVAARYKATNFGGQCLEMRKGPKIHLRRCRSGTNQYQDVTMESEGYGVIESGRGKLSFRSSTVAPKIGCLACASTTSKAEPCDFAVSGSADCSRFEWEAETSMVRIVEIGKCLTLLEGPKPGEYTCNGGSGQLASITEEGNYVMSNSRGTLEYKPVPVVEDTSKHGRCMVCATKNGGCTFAAAGSPDCTEFAWQSDKKRVKVLQFDQCLTIRLGPSPVLSACNDGVNQRAALEDEGRLMIDSDYGRVFVEVPDGKLPEDKSRWSYKGFHEIKCSHENCHFQSVLSLNSEAQVAKRHKEAAKAAFESWNLYETHGLYPTAHDEARLAATLVYALRSAGAMSDEALAPVLAWALRRNPALYEAWELAADFPAGGPLNASGQPSRDDLASHRWYQTLALLGKGSSSTGQQAADRFARTHLLKKEHWVQFPQLHRSVVGHLCGALSDGMLEELGEASEQCRLLRLLSHGMGWEMVEEEMLDEDALGDGNMPSDAFMERWEVLFRMAVVPGHYDQTEKLSHIIESLLSSLTVGYVNERSETFFAEHLRILLRSPYAHVLQLAGWVLPIEKRAELLEEVKAKLAGPFERPDRLWAQPASLLDSFLVWASLHPQAGSSVHEGSSAADATSGSDPDDEANPEIYKEMVLDRDERLELGWQEGGLDEGERSYDSGTLLKSLLRLDTHDDDDVEGGPSAADFLLRRIKAGGGGGAARARRRRARSSEDGPTASELVQFCMDDTLAA